MKFSNFFLTLLLSFSLQAAINFDQFLLKAYNHSPKVQSNLLKKSNAQLENQNAFYAFFPRLELQTSQGFASTQVGDPLTKVPALTFQNSINLNLSESLYHNNEQWIRWKISSLQKDWEEKEARLQNNQFLLEMIGDYLDFSLEKEKLEATTSNLQKAQKQYENAKALHQQGLKSLRDFQRFETEMQKRELDRMHLESSVSGYELKLRANLGEENSEHFESLRPSEVEKLLVKFSTNKKASSLMAFDLLKIQREQNALKDEIATRQVDLINPSYLKDVSLNATANYGITPYYQSGVNHPFLDRGNQSLSWATTLTVTFNLLDFGTLRREKEIAAAKSTIEKYSNFLLLRDQRINVDNLIKREQELEKSYKLSLRLYQLEQKNFQLMDNDYRLGKVSYLDLVSGLNNLHEAQNRYAELIFQYCKVILELKSLSAELAQFWNL